MAGRARREVACSLVLTAWLAAGCADGHIQSQEPYREAGRMSVRAVRSVDVLDAPVSGKLVGSVRRGRNVTALCFLRTAGHPVVRVTGPAEGFVTLDRERRVFDAGVTEVRSTVAPCER